MRVSPSQLMPGCVLIKDVVGKTGRPIVPKNTVLTTEHITISQKFLIDMVDVAGKFANDSDILTWNYHLNKDDYFYHPSGSERIHSLNV